MKDKKSKLKLATNKTILDNKEKEPTMKEKVE